MIMNKENLLELDLNQDHLAARILHKTDIYLEEP
jgi:hypothetical protein